MTFAVRPGVLAATLGDKLVLFSRPDRRLHVLNHAAAAVWALVDEGGFDRSAMVDHLADAFALGAATIGPDVDSALTLLSDNGLIETVDGSPGSASSAQPVGDQSSAVVWPAGGSTYGAINARIGLDVNDPELAAQLRKLLAPLRVDAEPAETIRIRDGEIQVGESRKYTVTSTDDAITAVVAEVNAAAVRSCRVEPVMHAAAVADDAGAVLLAAPADHGKSTLALALAEAGWTYLTDEAAAIVEDGQVRSYPKRIALDQGAFALFPERSASVDSSTIEVDGPFRYVEVPGQSASEPVPVRAVWLPTWRADSSVNIERLAPVEALHSLLENSFDFAGDDHEAVVAFDRLCELAERVPVARIEFGVTSEAIAAIESDAAAQLSPVGVFVAEFDDR